MIVDVAEIGVRVRVDDRHVEAQQALADVRQRRDGMAQLRQLAPDGRDLGQLVAIVDRAEQRFLELVDALLQLVDRREVVVDDEVHQRIEDEILALAQHVRRVFAARPDRGIGPRRAVADRDDIAAPDEHAGLAHREILADALERLHRDEQRLAVDLELRALVRLVGVLDGELMQVELALQFAQQLLARLVEADPDDPPGLDLHVLRVVDVQVPDLEAALVDGAIDDWTHLASRIRAGFFPGPALMQGRSGNKHPTAPARRRPGCANPPGAQTAPLRASAGRRPI